MARRYCGDITIYLTYRDAESNYRCRVVTPEASAIVHVGLPGVLTNAVDSPLAYDTVTHAALSFADEGDEGGQIDVAGFADIGDGGWSVTRQPRPGTRHSSEARAKAAVATLLGPGYPTAPEPLDEISKARHDAAVRGLK